MNFPCKRTIADLTYFYFPHLKGSRADLKGKTMAVFDCSEVSGTQNLVSQEMCRLASLILSHGYNGKGVCTLDVDFRGQLYQDKIDINKGVLLVWLYKGPVLKDQQS